MTLRTLTVRGIPEPVLNALRASAKRNRRSLNAEVLVWLEEGAADAAAVGRPAPGVGLVSASRAADSPGTKGYAPASAARGAEPAGQPYEVRRAFEEERAALLESDLRMTPEERVLYADRMLDDALAVRRRPNVHTIRAFDSWEDYLAWKRTDFLR
jgi:hypothetical protein